MSDLSFGIGGNPWLIIFSYDKPKLFTEIRHELLGLPASNCSNVV